jgi:hypothetical protein
VEIANAARVETYVRNLLPGFPLRACQGCDELARALGETYNSPLQDAAPWIDPNNPATYDFYGFYPVSIEGLDGSTVEATVTESLGAGGFVNSARAATREVRVRGILIGANDLALRAGQVWLNESLAADPCTTGDCNGRRLDFYAACPEFPVCYGYGLRGDSGYPITGLVPGATIPVITYGIDNDIALTGHFTGLPGYDGLTVSWGWSVYLGDTSDRLSGLMQRYGPVTPYRINKVRNPRFANDTNSWTTDATLTREVGGPPGSTTYGRMAYAGAGTYHLQTSVATSINSQNMLQFTARTTESTFTVNIRSVIDSSVMQSWVLTGSSDWEEYQLILTNPRDGILEFEVTSTGPGSFETTLVIVEGGTQFLPYFDGDMLPTMPVAIVPDVADPGYMVEWLGTPNAAESQMTWLGSSDPAIFSYQFCGEGMFSWLHVESGRGSILHADGFSDRQPDNLLVIPYQRYLHEVSRTFGPIATRDLKTNIGIGRVVEFTLTAATPYIYADLQNGLNFGDITDSTLWGPTEFEDTTPPDPPPVVVVDPDCPVIPAPPRPPIIENSCVITPGTWDRYTLPVYAEKIPLYAFTVPRFEFNFSDELRQARVRTYPNPLSVSATRTNLAVRPYPTGTGGWVSADPAAFPITLDTVDARRPGTTASRINRTTTDLDNRIAAWRNVGVSGAGLTDQIAIGAEVMHSFSVWVMTENAPGAGYVIAVTWYDALGNVVGISQSPGALTAPSRTWARISTSQSVPPGAVWAQMDVTLYSPTGGVAMGNEIVWIQDAMVVRNTGSYSSEIISPYFDGDMAPADGLIFSWSGTPFESESVATLDPFGYVSEFIISYAPAGSRVVVDSQTRNATIYLASDPLSPLSAANLLYGPDGGPMVWPELSCGIMYYVTVDLPPATTGVSVEMRTPRRE